MGCEEQRTSDHPITQQFSIELINIVSHFGLGFAEKDAGGIEEDGRRCGYEAWEGGGRSEGFGGKCCVFRFVWFVQRQPDVSLLSLKSRAKQDPTLENVEELSKAEEVLEEISV